ncbi:PDDEXK nuclease domain-containing protein [Paenarthrobacter sp. 2TAF44]
MNRALERTDNATSNFARQLAAQSSELAQQVAKDPYNFEFLGLSGEVVQRDLENALTTSRITETLREVGPGFSFVGGASCYLARTSTLRGAQVFTSQLKPSAAAKASPLPGTTSRWSS